MKQREDHEIRLQATAKERVACIARVRDYLARTGLGVADFARRINYSQQALYFLLQNKYHHVGGDDSNIRRAIEGYIQAHPVAPASEINGELYETANTRAIRRTFRALLDRPVAYLLYGPPGSQKTFGLENEVARLNREEIVKNGHGRRAYYVYPWIGITPRQLLHEVAIACGVPAGSDIARIYAALAFEFRTRRVLLVIDEAQNLDIPGFEILRRLLDRPPHMSLLLAGSHDLYSKFDRLSATLEQWNSRIIAKVKLPGLEEKEACAIVQREVGELLAQMPAATAEKKLRQIIAKATTVDAFEKGRAYINVRTLTNALNQIRAAAEEKEVSA